MTKQNNNQEDTKQTLGSIIHELEMIAVWFGAQDDVDLDEGIHKVEQAVVLLQEGKKHLEKLENKFVEIKKLAE